MSASRAPYAVNPTMIKHKPKLHTMKAFSNHVSFQDSNTMVGSCQLLSTDTRLVSVQWITVNLSASAGCFDKYNGWENSDFGSGLVLLTFYSASGSRDGLLTQWLSTEFMLKVQFPAGTNTFSSSQRPHRLWATLISSSSRQRKRPLPPTTAEGKVRVKLSLYLTN
jgi:hypothetical protein